MDVSVSMSTNFDCWFDDGWQLWLAVVDGDDWNNGANGGAEENFFFSLRKGWYGFEVIGSVRKNKLSVKIVKYDNFI